MKNRAIIPYIQGKASSRLGRMIVLTGARQTGKTTMVRSGFGDYAYIPLDDPQVRPEYLALSARQWRHLYPAAIVDEVQKAPDVIDSLKAAHDLFPETRFILLGSSQILLMEKVRESLAGRAALAELYPLTIPEMMTRGWDDPVSGSRFIRWLGATDGDCLFRGMPAQDDAYSVASGWMEHYLRFGGMPAIIDGDLGEEERWDWLRDYVRTYLQRDVRDLANMRELAPFVRAQKVVAALAGQCVNISNLARRAGISAKTARRFLSYLEMSFQVLLLPPWFGNQGKRLVRSPKVHFLDPGILRAILSRRGELTGAEFEGAVVAEIYKQLKNSRLPVECYHLRTADGREVDMLIEAADHFVAIEVKAAARVAPVDGRHLRGLADILDKPLRHSFVLSNDPGIVSLGEAVTAMPAAWFLGPAA